LEIKGLDQKMKPEWPCILRWFIEGTRKWLAEGLKPPAAVVKASAAYLSSEDQLGGWLRTCTLEFTETEARSRALVDKNGNPKNYTLLSQLAESYDRWHHLQSETWRGGSHLLCR
jgi:phage/plasmid-associated DNA primase